MESWENKIIRDKIDSLQQLPAGYLPDLSSKWEIIEAGLPPGKRVVPIWVKWTVAAAVTIVVFLTGINISKYNKAQDGMLSSIHMPPLPAPKLVKKQQVTVIVKAALNKENKSKKIIVPVPGSTIEATAKQDNPQLKQDVLKPDRVDTVTDTASVATEELVLTIPQPETPKRTKRRTFQKDFNDGQLVIDTGYLKPSNPQFSFKLQLHKSTGDEAQPSRRLELKQIL